MRNNLAILSAKTTYVIGRFFGKTGSALPGLVAEKIAPDLLDDYADSFSKGVFLVTGTNGKTTVTKMLVGALRGQGFSVLTNETGSNFTRGVLSVVARHSNLSGKLQYDFAVIESDEAYSRFIASSLKPDVLLVTNIMRDQLDRYGEIDHTAELILEAANLSKSIVLNADDPPVAELGDRVDSTVEVEYFGAAKKLRDMLPSDDELLGGEQKKITRKHTAAFELEDVHEGDFTIQKPDQELIKIETQFEGVHNGVNATAVVAALSLALPELDLQRLVSSLSEVKPAFGRGEKITLQDRTVHIALAKNPGGFNQNVRTFLKEDTSVVLILINDNYADSRDVSWLWDVAFDKLKDIDASIIVGGNRAFDMALRLQYSGVAVDEIDQDIEVAFEHALSAGDSPEDITVFPTYTAMLELRSVLKNYNNEVEIMK